MVYKTLKLPSLLVTKNKALEVTVSAMIGICSFRFVGKGLIENIKDYNYDFEILKKCSNQVTDHFKECLTDLKRSTY